MPKVLPVVLFLSVFGLVGACNSNLRHSQLQADEAPASDSKISTELFRSLFESLLAKEPKKSSISIARDVWRFVMEKNALLFRLVSLELDRLPNVSDDQKRLALAALTDDVKIDDYSISFRQLEKFSARIKDYRFRIYDPADLTGGQANLSVKILFVDDSHIGALIWMPVDLLKWVTYVENKPEVIETNEFKEGMASFKNTDRFKEAMTGARLRFNAIDGGKGISASGELSGNVLTSYKKWIK